MGLAQKIVVGVATGFVLAALAASQPKMRTVERGIAYPNQPIEVVGRTLLDRPFVDETKVLGDRDWLKHLSLVVRNISGRSIRSFDIDLLIKRHGKVLMGMPVYFRTYSKPTDQNGLTLEGAKKLGALAPDEIVKVSVSESIFLKFDDELRKLGVDDVESVTIDLRFVYFEDGTRWSMGANLGKIENSRTTGDSIPSVSGWMEYFFPKRPRCSSNVFLAFITGWQPVFLLHTNNFRAAPPPACVWFVASELETDHCSASSMGCDGDDWMCQWEQFADAVHTSDPGGGLKGYMITEPYNCKVNPAIPNPPLCSTCDTWSHQVFRADPQCGEPQGCGQTAQWGCISPLVDVNGVCQRSVDYQNACPSGYNSSSCACNPTPTPTPTPPVGCIQDPYHYNQCLNCGDETSACEQASGFWNSNTCDCDYGESPIVIDILGNGFDLTAPAGGVMFDMNSDGIAKQLSWTSPGSDDAWLVLDRNGNGVIDNGAELFGNFSPQPDPPAGKERNGFVALAEYDKPQNGGNSDGSLTAADTMFGALRLWQDVDHNGYSEPDELHALPALGLVKIELNYRESRRRDEHGNRFKYRSKVRDAHGHQLGRWAWDVWLMTGP